MERKEKMCLKDSVMGLIAGSGAATPFYQFESSVSAQFAYADPCLVKYTFHFHVSDAEQNGRGGSKCGQSAGVACTPSSSSSQCSRRYTDQSGKGTPQVLEVQKELVMFILLRLAEDVVTFQTLPAQRRRDIQTTMTQNMDKLFTFMLGILADSMHHYQQLKGDPTQKDKCQGLCRVALANLNTLAGYIDWVSFSYLTAQDCKLLQMFCLLLAEEDLQVEAAECLLIAVSRKGKLEDRAPLLNLFADSPIHCIMAAANVSSGFVAVSGRSRDDAAHAHRSFLPGKVRQPLLDFQPGIQSACAADISGSMQKEYPLNRTGLGDINFTYRKAHGEGLQEKRYIFLKRLCQVMCALSSQLCALTMSPENKIPMTFDKYLKSLLDFTSHPSQFLKSSTMTTWGSLFRHNIISKDHALQAMVPEFLRVSMSIAARVGLPSKSDSPSCEYSRLDFDSDDDFVTFFHDFRAVMRDVIRQACRLNPHTSFHMAAEWLHFQLSAPLDPGPNSSAGEELCTLLSPSYIQWEAMTFFCECVINQVVRVLRKEDLPVTQGVELLQIVLSYETRDPLILTCLLDNLTLLFPFMRYMNDFMPSILTKVQAEGGAL
ncbi:hypothetical protein AB205_0126620 [Aquarana catesbeiana]|uniref:Uncharacterized protein n=1 Tax=Aquarana catesbeiana TaxID=8400 RepID=A0A2G9RPE2_AQUCT|nr:hypothetical protein AB205_0126620 [Aquarana catesbeiana]